MANLDVILKVRVDEETAATLEDLAKAKMLKSSALARMAVAEYLERHSERVAELKAKRDGEDQ